MPASPAPDKKGITAWLRDELEKHRTTFNRDNTQGQPRLSFVAVANPGEIKMNLTRNAPAGTTPNQIAQITVRIHDEGITIRSTGVLRETYKRALDKKDAALTDTKALIRNCRNHLRTVHVGASRLTATA